MMVSRDFGGFEGEERNERFYRETGGARSFNASRETTGLQADESGQARRAI